MRNHKQSWHSWSINMNIESEFWIHNQQGSNCCRNSPTDQQIEGRWEAESILLACAGGEQSGSGRSEMIRYSQLACSSSFTLPLCHPFCCLAFLSYTWHLHSFHSPFFLSTLTLSITPQRYSHNEWLQSIIVSCCHDINVKWRKQHKFIQLGQKQGVVLIQVKSCERHGYQKKVS